MSRLFITNEEVRRGYHSGLSGRAMPAEQFLEMSARAVQDKRLTFETTKYPSPEFRITVRADKTAWNVDHEGSFENGVWTFWLPAAQFADTFKMKLLLHDDSAGSDTVAFWMAGGDVTIPAAEASHDFTDATVLFAYDIKFETTKWKPGSLVTLRTSVDGPGRDIYGVYRGDRWFFLLDRDLYPATFSARFFLDHSIPATTGELTFSTDKQFYDFTDAQVAFPEKPRAYVHDYDNFTSTESRLEQITVRSIGRETDDFDVIVIGSGMGGGTLADALSDLGVKVLVLEAGGLRFPVHMNELPRSETSYVARDELGHFHNRGEAHFNPGAHFNLGGRSVYWSGLIPRMQPWEFRDVWPASVRDYLLGTGGGGSGYDRAERQMRRQKTLGPYQRMVTELLNRELSPTFYAEDLPRSMHQPDVDDCGILQNVIQRSTGGFSTADLLLDSLGFTDQAGRNHLRVNLHHFVKRIETENGRATAVLCEDLIGRTERRFRGKMVVLSCGSLESAKLALVSGLEDPNTKIGHGLTDHPAYFYTKLHRLPESGPNAWLGDSRGHAKVMLRHSGATADAHAYNVEMLINAKYWDTRHADDDLWRRRVDNEKPAEVEIKFIFDSLLNEANHLISNGERKKPDVCVAHNQIDERYKDEIVASRNQILGALGVTGLSTHYDPDEWSEGIHGSVHHAGGTLRMSDDGSGVVDENLKFEAYENLYCCDVSVHPSIPAANPSLTLVALALRLADTLKDRLDSGA